MRHITRASIDEAMASNQLTGAPAPLPSPWEVTLRDLWERQNQWSLKADELKRHSASSSWTRMSLS